MDQDNARSVVNEDRLSNLPDELIYQILSCVDTKFAVQTCLLSPRWKLLWTSLPHLNFSSYDFDSLPKFAKFVKHVLTRRNHQTEVSSVKLWFTGAASQVFVKKIVNYAFAHNVQELNVISCPPKHHDFPPCLFRSPSLKHLSLSCQFDTPCLTPKTPWDFPSLTTLYLSRIALCDYYTQGPVDLFSKCVNLKNLTLKSFRIHGGEVFYIICPQLSNLMLLDGRCSKPMKLNTPQLENLTITNCSISFLNAPPGLSTFSFCNTTSLNKVSFYMHFHCSKVTFEEENARKLIDMLQVLHSARFLTLNIDIVEYISAFPDLLSHLPSPFSNLICLTIDTSNREDTYNFKMSTEARNFLLENSPSATFIMELPKEPPTKAMRQKEARLRRRANLLAEVESHLIELQASLEQGKTMVAENKQEKEKAITALKYLITDIEILTKQKPTQIEEVLARRVAQVRVCVEKIQDLNKQENAYAEAIFEKKVCILMCLKKLPKGLSANIEERYSRELKDTNVQYAQIDIGIMFYNNFLDAYGKRESEIISTYQRRLR